MKKKNALEIGGALLLAAAFSLIFYICNTPLGPVIGSDNAMYLTMGTALANGYAPYTEIFDHKGPLLFLVQWLPQALAGGYSMTAVFVQEVIVLFLGLLILRAIAKELDVNVWAVQLVYLCLTGFISSGGNLSEEYANLPTLFALYLALKVFGGKEKTEHLFLPAVWMGVCAMAAFLLRANNVLPQAALVLILAAALVLEKDWKRLGACAGGYALGLLLCAAPVVLWLAANGALYESFYGSILHNIMYAESGSISRVYMLLHSDYGYRAILMAVLSCLGAFALYRTRHASVLSVGMVAGAAAGGLAAFLSHKFYYHYLMVGAPMAALGAAAILTLPQKPISKKRLGMAAAAVCACILAVMSVRENQMRLEKGEGLPEFTENAQHLMEQVPQEERGSFMAYRVEPKWYVAAEALPSMRFYFLQEILAQVDPAVMDEIVQTFETNPPSYLVIFYNRPFEPPYDPRVQEIFETRYEFVDAAGQYQLLRLKQ